MGCLILARVARLDIALAFLAGHAALLLFRAWRLGDPLAIPLHQMQSGGLLIFALFMLTDPRSTPDGRAARLLFGAAVAIAAHLLLFHGQLREGVFFALILVSCATPLLDRLLPGPRFVWAAPTKENRTAMTSSATTPLARVLSLALAASVGFGQTAGAFCGFYVATTDTPLTNKASRVVLAHDGDTTQVTMASDVGGDPKRFGLVIPVPTVIKREMVKIVRAETVQHLVDYTKPRLVQYHDEDPCAPPPPPPMPMMAAPIVQMAPVAAR